MRYEPNKDDIIVMTYPKCGTTWVQYMLYLLLNDMQPIPSGRRLGEFVPFIECVGTDTLPSVKPRAMKTHLSFEVFPWSPLPRYVCVSRNPKDCCVSFFHHIRGFADHYNFQHGKFDDFFEIFLRGDVECCDYFDHLLSLWKHRDRSNVLFLTYEELSANTMGCAERLVDHLRPLFPKTWEPDVRTLVDLSSFQAMKAANPVKWSGTRAEGAQPFIRRGAVGDWKNYLTPEQSRRIDEKLSRKLDGTGAEKLWSHLNCF